MKNAIDVKYEIRVHIIQTTIGHSRGRIGQISFGIKCDGICEGRVAELVSLNNFFSQLHHQLQKLTETRPTIQQYYVRPHSIFLHLTYNEA